MFKPTRQYDSLILKALRQLKAQGPERKGHGICFNVECILETTLTEWYHRSLAMDRLHNTIAKWPEASSASFPIEGSYLEYWKLSAARNRWTNPRRLALLDWMIGYLETQEANRDKPAVA